jgi:hypothetical protein
MLITNNKNIIDVEFNGEKVTSGSLVDRCCCIHL